jgi:hypothetical protein
MDEAHNMMINKVKMKRPSHPLYLKKGENL